MNKNGPELNYGYFNTPAISQGKGDQNSVMAVSGGYAMGNKIRDPDLCWKFLRDSYSFVPEAIKKIKKLPAYIRIIISKFFKNYDFVQALSLIG